MDDGASSYNAPYDVPLARCLHDPTFEPQPSFTFADSHSDKDRRLHQTWGSLQDADQQHLSHPIDSSEHSAEPGFPFYQKTDQHLLQGWQVFSQPTKTECVWSDRILGINSMHQIAEGHGGAHQQIDIVPSPDGLDAESIFPKGTSIEIGATQDDEKAKTQKLERARSNASRQHAKTTGILEDNHEKHAAKIRGDDDEVSDKKGSYRERNRLAAARCREKKRGYVEETEVEHLELSVMNASLREQVQDLRDELTDLRTCALTHQDCNCHVVRYNISRAKQIASSERAFARLAGECFVRRHDPRLPQPNHPTANEWQAKWQDQGLRQ